MKSKLNLDLRFFYLACKLYLISVSWAPQRARVSVSIAILNRHDTLISLQRCLEEITCLISVRSLLRSAVKHAIWRSQQLITSRAKAAVCKIGKTSKRNPLECHPLFRWELQGSQHAGDFILHCCMAVCSQKRRKKISQIWLNGR